MSDVDILNLPVAVALSGAEWVPLVQGTPPNAVTRRAQIRLIDSASPLPAIASNTMLANTTGVTAVPIATTQTLMLDTIGSTQGTVLVRGASAWTATSTPTLGLSGLTVGGVAFANATSGTITINPATGALGSSVLTLPAATDTLVGRATTDALTNKTYNGLTVTTSTGILTITNGKRLSISNTIAIAAGADGQTFTFPSASATVGCLETAQTWTQQNTFAIGTIVVSTPLTLNQTWNNGAVTFTGALINLTQTAAASGSLALDIQKGGTSVFNVGSAYGAITAGLIGGGNGITANAPSLNIHQRVNNVAVNFTLAQLNFEDQASGNSSKIFDIQYSSTSVATFYKTTTGGSTVFVLGSTISNDSDPAMLITRDVGVATTGDAHGIGDQSAVNRTGTPSYNSYDAQPTFNGTNSYGHFVGFQSRPIYQMSGTRAVAQNYGLYDIPTVGAGTTLTSRYGAYIAEANNSGTITTQYGIYVDALATGGTNYSIFTAGSAPAYFGGAIRVSGGGVLVSSLPIAFQGGLAFVTDANATTRGSTVAGGGSNKIFVYSDGTNWLII